MSEKNIENIEENENLNEIKTDADFTAAGENASNSKKFTAWMVTIGIIGLLAIIGLIWIVGKKTSTTGNAEKPAENAAETEVVKEVKLEPDLLNSAGLVMEGVTQRPAIAKLYVTGTVELNPEKTEMATPLVGGRLENVYYGVGDYVNAGTVLATLSSPQVAQIHGKMHEAETRYELAQRNLTRVLKAENRVGVLSAQARLNEAETNLQRAKIQNEAAINQAKARLSQAEEKLKRTKKIIELGAGAGKDLIAAQTEYEVEQQNLQTAKANKDIVSAEATFKTAKADYDFQSNIGLNKEVQEAKAELETSRVDMIHIQDEMKSLGIAVDSASNHDHSKDSSLVLIRAPLSGVIIERKFNAGAGVEAAMPVFAISNLSTVYVIANVPESVSGRLTTGTIAEIKSPVAGTLNGRVSYIEPQLDEATRTVRVRLEVPNANGKLRAGMFTEIGFNTGTNAVDGQELVVLSEAIQRTGGKTVVFVPKGNEVGVFGVREVEVGGESEGYTRILGGLSLGETVVTKGSFVLKTQFEKGAMEEE